MSEHQPDNGDAVQLPARAPTETPNHGNALRDDAGNSASDAVRPESAADNAPAAAPGESTPSAASDGDDANAGSTDENGVREGGRRDRHRRNRRDRDRERGANAPRAVNDDGEVEPRDNRPLPNVPADFPSYSLNDLKRMPAHKLLDIADQLQHPRRRGPRAQAGRDLRAAQGADPALARAWPATACWKSCRMASASCARPTPVTWPARTTSTSRPARSAASTCAPATRSAGRIRSPKDGERYVALLNGRHHQRRAAGSLQEQGAVREPDARCSRARRFTLERGNGSTEDITGRVMDLMAPQGKGQRALIVSPPKAGKTMLMQNIASAIIHNHPGRAPDRAADRRAPGRSDRNAAHRARRSDLLHLRRAGRAPRAGRRDGDRARQAPGRAQEGRGDPARLDHPPGTRLQQRGAELAARCSPVASTPTRCTARSVSSAPRATSRKAVR